MPEELEHKVTRWIHPHTMLFRASLDMLEKAKQTSTDKDRFNYCLASMLFSAFCLEGFLNYVGYQKLDSWKHVEKLSPEQKLFLLCEVIDYSLDKGRRPFQTFGEIFGFRNGVAHPKPELLESTHWMDWQSSFEGKLPPKPDAKARWLSLCTIETANRFLEDTREIAEVLCRIAGIVGGPFPPGDFTMSTFVYAVLEDDE